tara:strand:+ start:1745 stop:2569 length:825 start_codon:yes stop_codon:yes gene_type:complete
MLSLSQKLSLNTIKNLGGGGFSNKYSCLFDGVDEAVIINEDAALKPTTAISISLWMKPTEWDISGASTNQVALGCVSSGGWMIKLQKAAGATQLLFMISVTDDTTNCKGGVNYIGSILGSTQTEALSGWVHVVATYTGGACTLYYNASTTGVTNTPGCPTATINYHASASRPVFIGADAATDTTGSDFFPGHIDEVAIYDSVLSASNVTDIYNSGTPTDLADASAPGNSDLIGYWRMGDPDGTSTYPTISDHSTNSNDGTMDNMESGDIVTDVP